VYREKFNVRNFLSKRLFYGLMKSSFPRNQTMQFIIHDATAKLGVKHRRKRIARAWMPCKLVLTISKRQGHETV